MATDKDSHASSSDGDDLDIIKTSRAQLNLSQYIDHVTQTQSEHPSVDAGSDTTQDDEDDKVEWSDDDEILPTKRAANRSKRKGKVKAKVAESASEAYESEDPEAAYNAFRNRKTVQRKKVAADTRKAKAAVSKRASNKTAIVGRKPKKLMRDETPDDRKRRKEFGMDSDSAPSSEDELPNDAPEYVQNRKTKFDRTQAKNWGSAFRFAPDYEDVEFSEDDESRLQKKPRMKDVKPQRANEDILMDRTGGIIPAPIARWLRDYQVVGAEFLHEAFVRQRGAVLGDDMGLGKTIQVIAFLTAAFGKTGDERDKKRMRRVRRMNDDRWYPRVLVVCPGSLMQNWQDELDRWGWWQVDVYHGQPSDREAALQAARRGRLEIMITTYSTYRINSSSINTIDWDCVIADECHTIKSRSSGVTKAMNEVNALCRIGLTGTAIQNKYEELWTLLNWSNPGQFRTRTEWKYEISDPLKVGQAHDATNDQLAKARRTAEKLVKDVLPNVFLRRMKTLIADQLPKKSDRVVFCPLTDMQATAYENFVNSEMVEYISRSSDMCDCDSGKKRGWCCYINVPGHGPWKNLAFPAMIIIQKIANHLAQLLPSGTDPPEKQSKDLDILQIAMPDEWKELYRNKDSLLNYSRRAFCGKWKVLKKLLEFWHSNGDKVLVFSHSVRLLRMLKALFDIDGTQYNFSYLDGSMSYDDRAKAVADFNADPSRFVFLISTRAGGVGLNITSANKVVVMDPNWNPSYDLQAQDRAYRIGQTRDVEVFRLVSAGTIEEIVYARQIYKQQQANIGYTASVERRYFRGVDGEKGKKGEIFGMKNLFAFQNDGYVLRDIVNKTNLAEVKAGVSVVGVDLEPNSDDEDDDDESVFSDAVFKEDDDDASAKSNSQIKKFAQAFISAGETRGRKNKRSKHGPDPIKAILARAGVEYTHENSEVIGQSKVEAKLSRKARELANDIELGSRKVFQVSQTQALDEDGKEEIEDSDMDSDVQELKVSYRYKPPEQVRIRQFCEIARFAGCDSPVDFALAVESMTQEERRKMLASFYRKRRQKLFGSGGG
ncbi:hypothetical protein BU16DRAFT_463647 [Lophium mytilinum]|uniref:DNA excision repair protein n=1 Tax=Lophium mytilinum TaxID=390894 RepID=A0A6A6QP90_9PEZI|nr:hypothetical protein BU16DRAFT_463647 [Lophium mytilinum]